MIARKRGARKPQKISKRGSSAHKRNGQRRSASTPRHASASSVLQPLQKALAAIHPIKLQEGRERDEVVVTASHGRATNNLPPARRLQLQLGSSTILYTH
jgi:hypothetical protein